MGIWQVARSKKQRRSLGLLLVGVGLVVFGAYGLVGRYLATHKPSPHIPATAITQATDNPDETPPTQACNTHKVKPSEPRKIELPSLGVSGCIQKVGIDQHNAIAAPSNVHLAGWYINSPAPGSEGISIIDGHVSGRYQKGVFANLKKLQPGDAIRIQLGDMSWRTFTVADTKSHAVDKAVGELFKPLDNVKTQLTLITCGGAFNKKTETYDQRVIVRAFLQ